MNLYETTIIGDGLTPETAWRADTTVSHSLIDAEDFETRRAETEKTLGKAYRPDLVDTTGLTIVILTSDTDRKLAPPSADRVARCVLDGKIELTVAADAAKIDVAILTDAVDAIIT